MSKLFYIIGASGAGKDSLINHCRSTINGKKPIVFAHRYITRLASTGAENHIHLTEEEFQLRQQYGSFALSWQSHGLHYGIGIEIENWLNQGLSVVVNGSRDYLPIALAKYPHMQPILITAHADIIKKRLHERGREDVDSIAKRIARNEQLALPGSGLICIDNNAELAIAANELLTILSIAGTTVVTT
jgi:ribose 1,5-bisphosphokinase